MANEVEVTITGNETVSDELETVADAAQQSERVIVNSMGSTEEAFDSAARSAGRLGEGLDMASGSFSQLSGGVGDVGGAMTAFTDLQNLAKNKALEMEAANLAVEQAQQDYNDAVAEFGPESLEARQAMAALNQAQAAAEPPTALAEWGEKLELVSPIIMGVVGATDLMILANTMANASWIKATASMVASKVALVATTAATGVATAAQWAWNLAMTANPIGLIIAAVMILIGVIILVATKTTFFQDVWTAVWGFIEKPVKAALDFIIGYYKGAFELFGNILGWFKGAFTGAFKFAIDFAVSYFRFIWSLPGQIFNVFKSVGQAIFAPFKWAFNMISWAWNNTAGRLSFRIPGWVPGIGGQGFSMPRLPSLAVGGDVMRSGLAMIHKGERIVPAGTKGLGGAGGDTPIVIVQFVGAEGEFRDWMKKNTRHFGGRGPNSVQVAWADGDH